MNTPVKMSQISSRGHHTVPSHDTAALHSRRSLSVSSSEESLLSLTRGPVSHNRTPSSVSLFSVDQQNDHAKSSVNVQELQLQTLSRRPSIESKGLQSLQPSAEKSIATRPKLTRLVSWRPSHSKVTHEAISDNRPQLNRKPSIQSVTSTKSLKAPSIAVSPAVRPPISRPNTVGPCEVKQKSHSHRKLAMEARFVKRVEAQHKQWMSDIQEDYNERASLIETKFEAKKKIINNYLAQRKKLDEEFEEQIRKLNLATRIDLSSRPTSVRSVSQSSAVSATTHVMDNSSLKTLRRSFYI